jgi:hypothetical protein
MKPDVRRADLVMAVAAARTAWILTGVSRDGETRSISVEEALDQSRMFRPGPPWHTCQSASTSWNKFLCVN